MAGPRRSIFNRLPFLSGSRRFFGYDIPPQEVAALYGIYALNNGANWTDKTGWFADKTCSGWYGVTVAGGHVTALDLSSNKLSGAVLETFLPGLPSLTSLKLSGNAVEVPAWLIGMFPLDNSQALDGTIAYTAA